MLAKSLKSLVLVQLAIRTRHDALQRVFHLKIKHHRIILAFFQMLFLAVNTLPQLRYRHIRLCRLVVHLQIPAMKSQGHIIAKTVILHRPQQPLRISLRPILNILVRMVQIARSVEVIPCIVGSAVRAGSIVTTRILIRKALVIPTDMLLRQLICSVRTKVILIEITPGIVVPSVVQHHVRQNFRIPFVQSRNQVAQRRLRSPIAFLTAVLTSRITHAATRRTCTRREPYHIKIRIDSRRILQQIDPFRTTVFGRRCISVITIPIECLQHYILALRRNTCFIRILARFRRTHCPRLRRVQHARTRDHKYG